MRLRYLASSLVFSLFCLTASAQTTGSIRGTLSDSDGQPVPGVIVAIKGDALIGGTRTAFTNESGNFRFPSLPIGVYSAELALQGFQTVHAQNIKVNSGATAILNFTIKATATETISVIGKSLMIDPTQSGFKTTFDSQMVSDLPTQHQMWSLMQQAPGMSVDNFDEDGDRVIAFGSNRQSNSWNIDGANVAGPETGNTWVSANPDLISEIQIDGIGASAESGNFSGAIFNVVTKSGTNALHGKADFNFQNDALTDVNVHLPDSPYVFHRSKYQDIDATLGGPILKDRIWFFGGVQSFRGKFIPPGVPPDTFAPPNQSDRYDFKVSARIGKTYDFTASIHDENYHSTDVPGQFTAPSATGDDHGTNPAWNANLSRNVNSNLHLELGYSGWWSHDVYDSVTGNHATPLLSFNTNNNTTSATGSIINPYDYFTYSHNVNAKATYFADNFLKSHHEFKFGVQYYYGSADTLFAMGPQGFYQSAYIIGPSTYLYQYQQVPYHYGGTAQETGFFIDDTVTVNKRLTLNLGVRYDHDRGSMPDYHRLAIGTPSISQIGDFIDTGQVIPGVHDYIRWDAISPRLGFAWQARADGKSVIRASFGAYRDGNVIGNWDSPPTQRPLYQILLFNPTTHNFDLVYEETPLDFAYNTHIKEPRTYQYAIGYEQQIGENNSFSVEYI